MNRIRLYLSSDKACIQIGQILFAEGYSVSRGKETRNGKSRTYWFIEYWKEN